LFVCFVCCLLLASCWGFSSFAARLLAWILAWILRGADAGAGSLHGAADICCCSCCRWGKGGSFGCMQCRTDTEAWGATRSRAPGGRERARRAKAQAAQALVTGTVVREPREGRARGCRAGARRRAPALSARQRRWLIFAHPRPQVLRDGLHGSRSRRVRVPRPRGRR
jgi:hypothetical protein